MGNDEWVESLRKRFHDLANTVQMHEGSIIRFEEKCEYFKQKIDELDETKKVVRTLQQQAMILKWLVGLVSMAAVGLFIKLF